jgi:hypothetical protein
MVFITTIIARVPLDAQGCACVCREVLKRRDRLNRRPAESSEADRTDDFARRAGAGGSSYAVRREGQAI